MSNELQTTIKEKYELAFLPTHMTHVNNLSSIFASNGLHSINQLKIHQTPFNDISNQSVQTRRANVTVTPTGKPLHDYVPLYFGRKTPMASALRALNNSLIFLAFDFYILESRPCVITDGNAADANTTFREFNSVDDLQILDPKSINTHLYAHNEEIKRRKQAELLVLDFLPIEHLKYIICPSDMVKVSVDNMSQVAGQKIKTYVGRNSYYYL
jgi:hypothetical protein